MKKSSFAALVLGTVGGVLFALGMCMALVEEWASMTQGIVVGAIGLVLALITVFVWRKMEHKAPIKISGKTALTILVALVGSVVFGVGMCLCLVWANYITGVVVGLVGMVVLLALIPLKKGLK
ncbi:MAG: hypothetical protein IJZ35_05805 [Clostridia bacterium]|nr:hypothetical protein [Clostridia bacterium]